MTACLYILCVWGYLNWMMKMMISKILFLIYIL